MKTLLQSWFINRLFTDNSFLESSWARVEISFIVMWLTKWWTTQPSNHDTISCYLWTCLPVDWPGQVFFVALVPTCLKRVAAFDETLHILSLCCKKEYANNHTHVYLWWHNTWCFRDKKIIFLEVYIVKETGGYRTMNTFIIWGIRFNTNSDRLNNLILRPLISKQEVSRLVNSH